MAPVSSFDPESRELANCLQKLYEALDSISSPGDVLDDKFADYIFFPLAQLLQKPALGDRSTVYLQKILGFLIEHAWSRNIHPELAKQFFILITFLIGGGPPQQNKQTTVRSDVSKASGCYALLQLFKAIVNTSTTAEKFRSDTTIIPTIGQAVSAFLNCALTGVNSLDLQKYSLEALNTLLFKVIKSGEAVASMLPGIISALTKILTPKYGAHRHYTVYVQVFTILQNLLELVFNDKDLGMERRHTAASIQEISAEFKGQKKPTVKPGQRIRSDQWLKASKDQLKTALSVIPAFRTQDQKQHQKPEVQSAIVACSFGVVENCSVSLDNCVSMFLDNIMLTISQDPQTAIDPTIAQQAKTQLEFLLADEMEGRGRTNILEVLQERVFDWIEALPRLLTAHDDTQARCILASIKSTVVILSKAETHSERVGFKFLFEKLLTLVQETVKISPSEKLLPQVVPDAGELEQKLIAGPGEFDIETQDIAFGEFGVDVTMTAAVQQGVADLVSTLGKLAPSLQTCQSLLEQVNNQGQATSASALAAWLAINSFEGMVLEDNITQEVDSWLADDDDDDDKTGSLFQSTLSKVGKEDLVVEMYTFCQARLSMATSYSGSIGGGGGGENTRFQDLLTANALRGLALVSKYMGKDFRHQLMEVLYPLIDLLGGGSSSSGVAGLRQAAQETLVAVARDCGYRSVRHMIMANYDYVIDSLSLKLNALDFSPQGPGSLATVVAVSGPQILPYLDDIVASLFAVLDNYHGYKTIVSGVFAALQAVVSETQKGYSGELRYLTEGGERNKKSEIGFMHVQSFEELLGVLDRKPVAPDLSMKEQFEREMRKEEEDDEEVHHPNRPFAETVQRAEEEDDGAKEEGDPTGNVATPEEQEQWMSPVPRPTWELVRQVVEYSDRFLLHESAPLRRQLLDLMHAALPILASASVSTEAAAAAAAHGPGGAGETKEEFLPVVSDVWPVLVRALDDEDALVAARALAVIVRVVALAGGFMATRVAAVWPRVRTLLQPQAVPGDGSAQQLRPGERGALEFVAAALTDSRVDPQTFADMLAAVGPYLGSSGELAGVFGRVNGDALWFELAKRDASKRPGNARAAYPGGKYIHQFVQFSI